MTVRWAFWRSEPQPQDPPRALPDDVGLRTPPRPPAAAAPPDPDAPDDRGPGLPAARTSGALPRATQRSEAPLAAPALDLDRTVLAAVGDDLAVIVADLRAGTRLDPHADPRALAVAATGTLAARLPALSGVDAGASDEPQDQLLHAYAELLAGRTQHRPHADHEDLLAVAHLAAAAVAVDAADEPGLLLLAGVPADVQLRAAGLLLAQTADDGAGPLDRLGREVRALFGSPG